MNSTFFLQLLNMSLTGSYVILFVLAARLLLRRAPKVFSYGLWGVALFRLVCPISFESPLSLMGVNPHAIPQSITYDAQPAIDTGLAFLDQAVNRSLPAATPYASMNPMQGYVWIGSAIWVIGALALLFYSLLSLAQLWLRLRGAERGEGNVYRTSAITSPFVLGVFRPKIYLPACLSEAEERYILLHERTHIRRLDHLVKLISFFVLCLHWFNPLVWVAFFVAGRDMEMACDEAVVKTLGSGVKKEYSTSLLALATGRRILGGTPLAFGEGDTRGRIQNLLRYKRPLAWVGGLLLAGVAVLCLCLALNPPGSAPALAPSPTGYPVEELWQARTPYVGSAPAVGKLIGLLPFSEELEYDYFALDSLSDSEGKTIAVHFKVTPAVKAAYQSNTLAGEPQLHKNAALLLALVDNADGVGFWLDDGSGETPLALYATRGWADHITGGDVRRFAESAEALEELAGMTLYETNGNSDTVAVPRA